MNARIKNRLAAAMGLAALGGFQQAGHAGLMMDLRAISGSPGTSITAQGKGFLASQGDVITFGLFARVSGTNGINDDTVQSAFGSIQSTGSMRGNLAGGAVAPFDANSQNGSVLDRDSDGDLDIGSAGSTFVGKIFTRAGSPTLPTTIIDANTAEIQVGRFTFTVTAGSSDVTLQFIPRTGDGGENIAAAALWFEDVQGAVGSNPTTSSYTVGEPVTLLTPEPASAAIMTLAAAALVSQRRRQRAGETRRPPIRP